MSLYLKYRPTQFEELKGNEEIITTLKNMMRDKEKFPHSLLLSGPTGCGKTTLARIIAKELECADSDLKELDVAHFRGIDTIREIRMASEFMPMEGTCKVWVLDEVHKQTNDAQNAMLKILEDTPSHVYFILCTTDPQKLLPTIRGRCSTFQVRTLTDKEMFVLLRTIAHEEGARLEREVFDQIIQDSQGHPRNAIQILEQVLNVEPEKQVAVARRYAEQQSQIIELCRALISNKPWATVASILGGLKDEDPEGIRRVVLGYCQSVLLKSDNMRAGAIMEAFIEPMYNTLFPGVVFACYSVAKS